MSKSQWTQPQLIVLSRAMPEESVLTVCKLISEFVFGPTDNTQDSCQDLDSPSVCGACLNRSTS